MSVVSKQLFMSMITFILRVQVAQLCTSSISSSPLVFNLTALRRGCSPAWHRLTQFKAAHLKQITFWAGETVLHIGLPPYSLTFHLATQQVCISTNCTFHEKWNGTCIYTEITDSLCFVVRRFPPPHTHRVSSCLSFPILCQIVSVRLVKSAKLEQQSPNLKQDKSNKIKMSDENMWH